MVLAVGEEVLGRLHPQSVRMAALSGGVLVIGGLLGRQNLEEDDEPAYSQAARYRERFLAELGDTRCAPLRERVEAPGGLESCVEIVERAATILLDLLAWAEPRTP
jgi:uncharacterized membrane protein